MRTSSLPDTGLLAEPAGFELAGGVPAELLDQAQLQARAVGYAQGWAQGLREAAAGQAIEAEQARIARQDAAERQAVAVSGAVTAVTAAADRLTATVVELTDELCDRMLAAAVELAAALLGQELSEPRLAATAAVRRVLAELPDEVPVTIRLNPADHATLTGAGGPELIEAVRRGAASRVSLEADPSLAPGDAVARAAALSVDARLTAAVQRMREYVS